MKKQIVIIHGGNAFDTYEEYISYLKNRDISLARLMQKDWKRGLGANLWSDYEVITPQMPNSQNARYAEWKIWFERIIPLLNDTVVFIGHSLGGIFLAKYLSENTYAKKIKAVFLVAAPYNTVTEHPLVDFNLAKSLDNFSKQVDQIFLYHSKDDQIVPFSNFERYQRELPNAKARIFEAKQHFNQENFPELIEDIKGI